MNNKTLAAHLRNFVVANTQVFYVDTSSLMHARHYLATVGADEAHFPQGVRTGKVVVEALDVCREIRTNINVITSYFTKFEMNQRYRRWNAKKIFLDLGIPLETIDGRDRDIFGSLGALPEVLRNSYKDQTAQSMNWVTEWEYHDVVELDITPTALFEIADPLQYWEPHFTLIDALHVAAALNLGANYFVTCDKELADNCNRIASKLKEIGRLPNGVPYAPEITAIKSAQFLEEVSRIKQASDREHKS